MKEFIHVLRETLQHAEFVSGSSTTYSLEQLRALYEHDKKYGDASAAWTVARVGVRSGRGGPGGRTIP